MNFVDAAVSILSDNPGQALHVEELCRRAVEGDLLSRPGKAPLRSLKGRLTSELKKGEESRVAKVGDNLWRLSAASELEPADKEISAVSEAAVSEEKSADIEGAEQAPMAKAADAGSASDDAGEAAAPRRKRRRRRSRTPRGERTGAQARSRNGGEQLELAPIATEPTPDRVEVPAARGDIEAIIAPDGRGARVGDVEVPAEDAAGELYADELESLDPDAGIPEFSDAQTADEDRPMLPEIGGRKERQQKYREQRKEERKEERERRRTERKRRSEERVARGGQRENGRGTLRSEEGAARSQLAATARPLPEAPAHVRPGNAWGQAAAELLASNSQAVQVKQLAQMMRKLDTVPSGFPASETEARPLLHAALLAHIRSIENAGLRSDIVYRGRDLFAAAAAERGKEDTEHALASALIAQRLATHSALTAVLQELPMNGFMQLVHVYLMQTGWSDVQWVKRVATANYAIAKPLATPGEILISACASGGSVERRGVGELRAGVAAKSMQSGLLFSAHELSDDARAELEREGAPIHVVAGAVFVDLVMRAGIGVQHESVPVTRLDATFWSELARP